MTLKTLNMRWKGLHYLFTLLFLWISSFYSIFLLFKDELSHANRKGSKLGTPHSKSNSSVSCQSAKANAHGHSSVSNTPLSSHVGVSPVSTESASAMPLSAASDAAMETNDTPTQDQEVLDGLKKNLDRNSDKPGRNKTITAMQEVQQSQCGHGNGQCNSCSSILGVMISHNLSIQALFNFFYLIILFLSRWRRETRKVWGTSHYRIHSWAGHGPWQLQRNEVEYSGLAILSSWKMPGYKLGFIREQIISNYSFQSAPAAFYVK